MKFSDLEPGMYMTDGKTCNVFIIGVQFSKTKTENIDIVFFDVFRKNIRLQEYRKDDHVYSQLTVIQ